MWSQRGRRLATGRTKAEPSARLARCFHWTAYVMSPPTAEDRPRIDRPRCRSMEARGASGIGRAMPAGGEILLQGGAGPAPQRRDAAGTGLGLRAARP